MRRATQLLPLFSHPVIHILKYERAVATDNLSLDPNNNHNNNNNNNSNNNRICIYRYFILPNGVNHGRREIIIPFDDHGLSTSGKLNHIVSGKQDVIKINSLLVRKSRLWCEYYTHFGNIHGISTVYHDSGTVLLENNYENGVKEGMETEYYKCGAVRHICYYKRGNLNGIKRSYLKCGLLYCITTYKDGVKHGEEESYHLVDGECSTLQGRFQWKYGTLHGRLEYFWDSGILAMSYDVTEGRREGIKKEWNPTGIPAKVIPYLNGQKHGIREEYNLEGELIRATRWEHGVLVQILLQSEEKSEW